MELCQKAADFFFFTLNILFFFTPFFSSLFNSFQDLLALGQVLHLVSFLNLRLLLSVVLLIPLFPFFLALFKELSLALHMFDVLASYLSFFGTESVVVIVHAFGKPRL